MSAGERKQRIIASIIHDFGVQPRLNNDRGTAILVAASIYDACHYYQFFQNTLFGRYCGIITSYEPNHNAISREPKDSGADTVVDLIEPGGVVVLDDFTPCSSWPPVYAGRVDVLREQWLIDERFTTVEVMVADDSSVLIAPKR